MTEWNVYRDERGTNHLPGPNPGTPYTLCMLDAGLMIRYYHNPDYAGKWCSDCYKVIIEGGVSMADKEKQGEDVQDPKKEDRPVPSIEKNTSGGTSGSIQGGAGNAPGESGGGKG